jgi:hypothetical protein
MALQNSQLDVEVLSYNYESNISKIKVKVRLNKNDQIITSPHEINSVSFSAFEIYDNVLIKKNRQNFKPWEFGFNSTIKEAKIEKIQLQDSSMIVIILEISELKLRKIDFLEIDFHFYNKDKTPIVRKNSEYYYFKTQTYLEFEKIK